MKKVLIVEDDQTIRGIMKLDMEKYSNAFETVVAEDGLEAMQKLKVEPISLVVTDLKMPNVDGFALLGHIMEEYPQIPVIIMTAYGTPKLKEAARNKGVVDFIDKPFTMEFLAEKILQSLQLEADGGTLHGVSTGMFLQLIEMEQKTCTVRVMEKVTDKQGVLFFNQGVLLDAKTEGVQGEEAAYEIFSWDKVSISIQNTCPLTTKQIKGDLQGLLLEAMRRKDETAELTQETIEEFREFDDDADEEVIEDLEVIEDDFSIEDEIRQRLEREVGVRSGLKDIYHDASLENLSQACAAIGADMGAGELRLVYVKTGGAQDTIFIPSRDNIAVAVDAKCPRDRVIGALASM